MSTAATTNGHYRSSHWVERMVLSKLFWTLAVTFLFAYPIAKSVGRRLPNELPVLGEVPRFSFYNEAGRSFGTADLKGRVYVAHFMSSTCAGQCDLSFKEMQKVQHRIRGVVDRAAIVSFTINPAMDTSEVLYAKARDLKANPNVWRLLTGPALETKSLLLAYQVPGTTTLEQVVSANQLVLVDQDGKIRGYYAIVKDGINKLMIDLGLLINRPKQS